jgi:NAD(P)H-hydrate epimerase
MALKITYETVKSLIKPRPENSHKGTFGTLQLFCGSKNMTGAPYLAACGALRCGTGLLYISAKGKLKRILQAKLAEPVFCKMRISPRSTAFVAGCGLGKKAKYVKKILSQSKPAVIDADAINYLAKHKKLLIKKRCEAILTPHVAEMSRLTGKDADMIESDREACAAMAAAQFNCTVVLKGHETVIALPSGETFINTTGNSGLSKGGSGDVLAGMAGAFLAQGYSTRDAAIISVWLHGMAADNLKKNVSKHGLLPSEIPLEAAKILSEFE